MSGPSEKAIEALARQRATRAGYNSEGSAFYLHIKPEAAEDLAAAHDPALGLDRSVCLREWLEEFMGPSICSAHPERIADCPICCPPSLVELVAEHKRITRKRVIAEVVEKLREPYGAGTEHWEAADRLEREFGGEDS